MRPRSASLPRPRSHLRPLLLLAALAAVAASARAQDHVYTWADETGYWDDLNRDLMPGDWTDDPMGMGAFRIGPDPAGTHDHVTIRVGTFTGTQLLSDVGLTIEGGGLTLSDASTVGGDLNLSGGALQAGELNVSGNLGLSGGVVTATALNLSGGLTWSGGDLGSGSVVNANDVAFGTADGQTLTSEGTLNIAGAATWAAYGTDLENGGGTIHVTATGSLAITNTGVVTGYDANGIGLGAGIVGGTLVNDGTLTIAATNFPEDDSHVSINVDSLQNNGTIDVTADGQALDLYGATALANAGSVLVGYDSVVQMGAGTGDLVNSGTFAIDGGGSEALLYSNSGSVLNSGTIHVAVDPNDYYSSKVTLLSSVGVTNSGSIDVSVGSVVIDAPQVTNSGTIDVHGPFGNYRIGNLDVEGTLDNAGTIRVDQGGEILLAGDLEGSGSLVVDGLGLYGEQSTLQLLGDFRSGSITVQGGGLAYVYGQFSGGTMTVDGAGSQLGYEGTFAFDHLPAVQVQNGGEVILEGTLDNSGRTYDPGQADPLPTGFHLGEQLTIEGGSLVNSEQLYHGDLYGVTLNGVALDGGLDLSAGGEYAVLGEGTTFPDGATFRIGRDGSGNGTSSALYLDRSTPITFVGANLVFGDSLFSNSLKTTQAVDVTFDKDTTLSGDMDVQNQGGGHSTLTNQGQVTVFYSHDRFNLDFGGGFEKLVNEGSILVRDVPNSALVMNPTEIDNRATGTLTADGTEVILGSDTMENEGLFQGINGATLDFYTDFANAGRFLLDDASTASFGYKTFPLSGGYAFTQVGAGARTTIDGTLSLIEPLVLGTGAAGDGGLLDGHGTIDGSVENVSGLVAPGDPQILTITGDYVQGIGGTSLFDIEGLGGPGAFDGNDEIVVGGDLSLDGTINFTTGIGYAGDVTLFTFGGTLSIAGTLSVVDLTDPSRQFRLVAGPGGTVQLQAVPEPASLLALAGGLAVLARRRRR